LWQIRYQGFVVTILTCSISILVTTGLYHQHQWYKGKTLIMRKHKNHSGRVGLFVPQWQVIHNLEKAAVLPLSKISTVFQQVRTK
jgi:hypothetical protein